MDLVDSASGDSESCHDPSKLKSPKPLDEVNNGVLWIATYVWIPFISFLDLSKVFILSRYIM